MKRQSIKHGFNLVEILMAIFVIAIGVTGIMGLMPVGFNAARDARAENYANSAVNQFVAWFKLSSRGNWGTVIGGLQTRVRPTESFKSSPVSGNALFDENDKCLLLYEGNASCPELYKIVQQSPDGKVDDFTGVVWVRRITAFTSSVLVEPQLVKTLTNDSAKIARIQIEISWPEKHVYSLRKKRTFVLDLYNPN